MPYTNSAYLSHVRRELQPQARLRTATTVHSEPGEMRRVTCKCDQRSKPPAASTLDRLADEKLAYGYALPYTRRRRKPPSLSRWT